MKTWPSSSAPAVPSTAHHEPTHEAETRGIYRALLVRDFRPSQAANLTALVCGIRVRDHRWKLHEVNRLLLLRQLHGSGRFGALDGASSPN
jgi:hypothetical protein